MKYVRPSRRLLELRRVRSNDEDFEYEDEQQIVFDLEVSSSFEAVDTGLVFPDGTPIYRDDSGPMGFIELHEWE